MTTTVARKRGASKPDHRRQVDSEHKRLRAGKVCCLRESPDSQEPGAEDSGSALAHRPKQAPARAGVRLSDRQTTTFVARTYPLLPFDGNTRVGRERCLPCPVHRTDRSRPGPRAPICAGERDCGWPWRAQRPCHYVRRRATQHHGGHARVGSPAHTVRGFRRDRVGFGTGPAIPVMGGSRWPPGPWRHPWQSLSNSREFPVTRPGTAATRT